MRHEIVLSGHGVRLVPLAPHHAADLFDFVDPGMWAGMAAPLPGTSGDLAVLFQARLDDPATIPFAVTDGRTGALLGTTSLRDYVTAQQRLEIGGTFYGRQFWGSHVNPASKHMLLAYAYEVLRVHRVAFRCDARNTRSATAIERLGAQFEGTLRGHRAAPDGGRADTAVFSILSQEWPQVGEDLRRRLAPFAVRADYGLSSFAAF
ncbi:GNAT family N-acetyltransferase [Arthrobacter sp. ok362]|jgi:RimJ/RimL family protein N-acetyltransferase|uniref:GNAT family N-acetyltransferase n=1 Tax=Arthrobacter sp. ok362 TaxID=1761745 RepID=UPI00088648A3|nr:GNAT family protein [Arthrobacter sp. ok362]SDK51854.1 Protein N-acetyltransferase, RimJ/RimL family [Arthrobacter sp. ok362]